MPALRVEEYHRIQARKVFDCDKAVSVLGTAGTIFHDSICPCRSGFLRSSCYRVAQGMSRFNLPMLKVVQTAGICATHRESMRCDNPNRSPDCTVDATKPTSAVVGATWTRYRGNKTMVLGALQRGGQIRLKVGRRDDKATLQVSWLTMSRPTWTTSTPTSTRIRRLTTTLDSGLHQTVNHSRRNTCADTSHE